MCFGTQEFYAKCGCPGNFNIRSKCRNWNGCQSRVEENMHYLEGYCPACQYKQELSASAYAQMTSTLGEANQRHHEDNAYARLNRDIKEINDRYRGNARTFRSFRELEAHHTAVIAAARQRCVDKGNESDRARAEYKAAKKDFERAARAYREREAFLDDAETYEGW